MVCLKTSSVPKDQRCILDELPGDSRKGMMYARLFFFSWPNDGYSSYIGILVLIFGVQSNLNSVSRYYLQYMGGVMYVHDAQCI